jgi:hypothetical protein
MVAAAISTENGGCSYLDRKWWLQLSQDLSFALA